MRHTPVLLKEVIDGLNLQTGDNAIDCTLGDGGQAEEILRVIAPSGQLLGIDADATGLLEAKRYLYQYENRLITARANFRDLKKVIQDNKFKKIKAILFDLGWSSPQFMERGRGFSFLKNDEPLDMRFYALEGQTIDDLTAEKIINAYSEKELDKLFHRYGQIKNSAGLARSIIQARTRKSVKTTGQLVKIILDTAGFSRRPGQKIHPATQVFQALRIEVNNELEVLKQALPQAVETLEIGGRLAVISFHSLEDRIVKQFFVQQAMAGEIKLITKKPIMAGEKELLANPRARSAKLRVVEKI
ncbi:MAG: 16S rRNA (cytosine(1402)-N(4))-methyltransferase [Candidatus Magasanikbacteria bacterium CG10_big_fil_rev_8_21_14_0_10_40_10]|uniref:Ribosomal RNA small subunit methyltransferase H n=1 Tax=Candidatus Magasanikbacteria bacterium CG10_big_fil_rev_8_21_14_0_10_40_10 TaxID=1974648 RepID=A0A2M6W527_9BACT|nr:MAG: 16S rRNA (cytosine(1402)-N(4))-methyltransferase [Candidatus Magasanikbacteria bacterium CG10_big_fil_rev_8_21_14_0_10_40_10]